MRLLAKHPNAQIFLLRGATELCIDELLTKSIQHDYGQRQRSSRSGCFGGIKGCATTTQCDAVVDTGFNGSLHCRVKSFPPSIAERGFMRVLLGDGERLFADP